jgi:hypothetical protein
VIYKAGTKVQPPMNNAFRTNIATQQMKYWFLQQVKKYVVEDQNKNQFSF